MWNLDKWAGLARTTYILDGSVASQATIDPMKAVTGSGQVTVPTPLATRGGEVRLVTGATAGTAQVTLPPRFGNVAGSLVAAVVSVEGISSTGLRPTLKAGLVQQGGAGNRAGIQWDENGAHLAANTSLTTVMGGNMVESREGSLGLLVDVAAQKIKGHYGYSVAEATWATVGTFALSISNETKDAPNYKNHTAAFRRAELTLIWGTPGNSVTKVL